MPDFDIDQLAAFVDGGRVVPVIGRDVLALDSDGGRLVDHVLGARLAAALGLPAAAASRTVNQVAFEALSKPHEKAINDIVFKLKSVADAPPLAVPDALKKLARVKGFRLFVTTTTDGLLLRAVQDARTKVEAIAYKPNGDHSQCDLTDGTLERGVTVVYQLFGQITLFREDSAVTEEGTLEFLHALQSDSRRPKTLISKLCENHLLIMGCSYPDWLARFFLRTVRQTRLSDSTDWNYYLVDDRVHRDPDLVAFLRHHRVRVWEGTTCGAFIDELARRCAKFSSVDPAPPQRGSIFVSYSRRNDVARARRLRDELEKDGFKVWFDEYDIPPGSTFESVICVNIASCTIFMPLMSRETEERDEKTYFRREWNHAAVLDTGNDASVCYIWPVVIDQGVEPVKVPARFLEKSRAYLPDGVPTPAFLREVNALFEKRKKVK